MTTKRLCVSFPRYIFDKYLLNSGKNRSKYIEEMMVRGIEAETSELSDYRAKLIEALKSIREKDDEIKKLKARVGKLSKKPLTDYDLDPGLRDREKLAEALGNAGVLRRGI